MAEFVFYEIVKVLETCENKKYRLMEGTVIGISEGRETTYAIKLTEIPDRSVMFGERDLVSTGRFSTEEREFSGEVIRVTTKQTIGGYLKSDSVDKSS